MATIATSTTTDASDAASRSPAESNSWFARFFETVRRLLGGIGPGDTADLPLLLPTMPGLVGILDVALWRAHEPQLTGTLTTSHMLLRCWIDIKQQAVQTLQELQQQQQQTEVTNSVALSVASTSRRAQVENFARTCYDAACDAMERMSTDKLAHTANLSDPFESLAAAATSSGGGGGGSGVVGISSHHVMQAATSSQASTTLAAIQAESALDTGRRVTLPQRRKDCWESSRLYCPDYIWGDDVLQHAQKSLKLVIKHAFYVDTVTGTDPSATSVLFGATYNNDGAQLSTLTERHAHTLVKLIQHELPTRLTQFKAALDADAVVTQRLYLVKCEYRAPLRSFWEAHQAVQRAPPLPTLLEYASLKHKKRERQLAAAKQQLESLLATPALVTSLALERLCDGLELDMAKALFTYCELARYLDAKKARIKDGVLPDKALELAETLRRLKLVMCRKSGPDTSPGIRPLLLDLQGMLRETTSSSTNNFAAAASFEDNVAAFIADLEMLSKLCTVSKKNGKAAFIAEKNRADMDLPAWLARGCTHLDAELLQCQLLDWKNAVQQQHALTMEDDLESLAEELRATELQVSLAMASDSNLQVIRERIEKMHQDRITRFQVAADMVQDVCVREMAWYVTLQAPAHDTVLELRTLSSAPGIFGELLQSQGETLPIG